MSVTISRSKGSIARACSNEKLVCVEEANLGFPFPYRSYLGGGKLDAMMTIHLGRSFEKHKFKDGFCQMVVLELCKRFSNSRRAAKFCQKQECFNLLAFCWRKLFAMSDTNQKKTNFAPYFRPKDLTWFDM